jgi:hypothetical protein
MRLPSAFRKRRPSTEHRAASLRREVTTPVVARKAEPSAAPDVTSVQRRPAIPSVSAARLDELRTQAQFARERYDLYKAKAYGPHLTSPARLRELERESVRTAANLSFAKSEAGAARKPGEEDQARVRTGTR